MATLNLKGTSVFQKNYEALQSNKYRFIVNQGGSRSSKTYSIAQLFLILLYQEHNEVLSVVRKTLPALKFSAMKDFLDIMKVAEVYNENNHNRTDLIYRYNHNELEFFAVDQPQKIRGRKRKYLWCNEANELTYEDFQQLNLRTTGTVFMDYNPSDEYHWIYEHILTRDDAILIKSTYKDNPFIDKTTVNEIERLQGVDENYWRIYGLGERGVSQTTIYTHWQFIDNLPEGGETIFGLDFGYNHQMALSEVRLKDDVIYARERIYETHMTIGDVIDRIKTLEIKGTIYADSAEPQAIEEMKRAGLNVIPSKKGADSVGKGIDNIKRRKLFITKDSVNMLKEIKSYRWKEKNEKIEDKEPVKENDHLMDAIRYAVHTRITQPIPGIFIR